MLLTFTRDSLYVAFKAYDPDPFAIRAHLTDRDAAWNDDWVGVVLDTFNDERRNYLLLVNPLGVQMDNIEVTSGSSEEWDGIWESTAGIVEWGWAVEMRIPFSSLSFQRKDGPQIWGFDAVRGYPRSTFRQMGAFVRDRNNNCYLCQAIKITGFEGVTPGRNIEVVPTVTATGSQKHATFPGGPLSNLSRSMEAGLTGRWGLTPNLTLNGTVNPDFSQVEADALQFDINEPFALSYPEKRPFFMEASDFFATSLSVVYTQSIRDPAWGGKLTGKEGAHTIGAFVTRDALTNLAIAGTGAYLEDQRGNLLSRSVRGQAAYQGPLQSHAAIEIGRTREAFIGREFDQTTLYLHNCMRPSGATNTYVNVYIGDRIDHANVRPGKRVRVDAGIEQRVGRHLQLAAGPSFERMRVEGGRLYTALQGQVSAGYQFTPRAFIRAIVQYVDYRYNVGLYATARDPRSQRTYTQVLFSYKVNPRTVWFIGYTDNRVGTDEYVLTQRDRTLFTKVGYAWTF